MITGMVSIGEHVWAAQAEDGPDAEKMIRHSLALAIAPELFEEDHQRRLAVLERFERRTN